MTALHLVYLASIAGAILFFVAGAAVMAARARRGEPNDAQLREALASAHAFAQQQQAHAVELERELARTRTTAAGHVEHASAEIQRVGAELERARAETANLRAQLDRAAQSFANEAGTKEITKLRTSPERARSDSGAPPRADSQMRELQARVKRADTQARDLAARAERAETELRTRAEQAARIEAELRTRLERAERAEASLRGRAEHAEGELRARAAKGSRTDASVRELESRANAAEAELAAARAVADATERELRELRTRAERAERDLAAAMAQSARLTQELDRARTELTATAGELAHATTRARDLDQQLAERTQSVRDLATENEQLKGRVRDAEGLRAEYVRLRTATVESEYLKTEIARLEQEIRTLRSDALGGTQPPPRTRSGRITSQNEPAPGTSGTISEALLRVLDRFANAHTRSLAIADSIGFPLASTGNDAQALAAYATLLAESAARANQFLPVARTVSIDILDERGARVSVWPFEIDGDRLFLANLSVAPVETARVEATLAELAAILAPSAIVSRSA